MIQVWNLETERSKGAGYEQSQIPPIRREEERVQFIAEAPRNADEDRSSWRVNGRILKEEIAVRKMLTVKTATEQRDLSALACSLN